MSNAVKEKFYKEVYAEARDSAYANAGKLHNAPNTGVYTTEMLYAIRDMAINNVWPDGSFGDDECIVWGLFHRLCDKS